MTFDPSTISGLKCFEADTLALSDNDPVSTWNSYGTSATLTGTLTARPTYKTNIVNGLPVVRFDQVNDELVSDDTGTWGDFFLCVVYKETGTTNAFVRLADKKFDTGMWLGRNGTAASTSWGGGVLESTPPFGIFVTQAAPSWHILSTQRSGDQHIVYGDGGERANQNTVSTTALDASTLVFGNVTTGIDTFFGGDVAAIFWAQRALTFLERNRLHNYLADKYAVTITAHELTGSTPRFETLTRPQLWRADIGGDIEHDFTSATGLTVTDFSGSNSGSISGGSTTFTASNGMRLYRTATSLSAAWSTEEVHVTTFGGADTTDRVYAGLIHTDDNQWIFAWADKLTQQVGVELRTGGTTNSLYSAAATVADGIYVKLVLCGGTDESAAVGQKQGGYATVWTSTNGTTWTRHGGGNVGIYLDMQLATTLANFRHGFAVKIVHGAGGTKTVTLAAPFVGDYFGFAGLQNLQAVMNDDLTAYQDSQGRYYFTATCGGLNGLGDGSTNTNTDLNRVNILCAGVLLFDANANTWTLVGLHFFMDRAGTRIVGNVGNSYTRKLSGAYVSNWVMLVATWGEDTATTVTTRRRIGSLNLTGVQVYTLEDQTLPLGNANNYDATQIYQAATVLRFMYTYRPSAYRPVVVQGADLDNLSVVSDDTTAFDYEGCRLYGVNGVDRYVASHLSSMREYAANGSIVGNISLPAGGLQIGLAVNAQPLTVGEGLVVVGMDTVTVGNDPWSHGDALRWEVGAPLEPTGGGATVPALIHSFAVTRSANY